MPDIEPDLSWQAHAACIGTSVDFYSEGGHQIPQAVAICRTCPVIDACLDYAIENHEKFGVWGGQTARARRRIAKARRLVAAASAAGA